MMYGGTNPVKNTITVSLPEDIRSALDEMTRTEGIPADRLVGEALEEYIFVKRYRLLRDRLMSKAQAQGIRKDQDVFDLVS